MVVRPFRALDALGCLGVSGSLTLDDETLTLVHNGFFTTHDSLNPDFRLKASTIRVYENDYIVFKNMVFYVGKIPIFSDLEDAFRWFLTQIHETTGLPWAYSIIVLTVLVRLALVPLFVKQMKSSNQMQAIAPKIKALQVKHKGDRKKLQEEQMKLYQEHSVNPFGACLPLVFQMPVFFALYLVLRGFSSHPPGGQKAIDNGDFAFLGSFIPNITKATDKVGLAGIILIHTVFGMPVMTLLFRNYYASVPSELFKAARIDGGGFWRIFLQLMLPMSLPIFAVATIMQMTNIWNDFLIGLVFAGRENLPMTVQLNNVINTTTGERLYNVNMAAPILTSLLPLAVYLISGRWFVRGIAAGAVKG